MILETCLHQNVFIKGTAGLWFKQVESEAAKFEIIAQKDG